MSTLLSSIDLTGAIVGTQKTLTFNQFVKFNPSNFQEKAHLGLFNESGCGLNCVMQASGDSAYLPAGGWTTFEIEPNDSSMTATVTYTLPNPPVSQMNAVYYAPGETIPQAYTLGNSPIGIGGTVNTSNVQTLSNEGNASNTLVIDMGDSPGFNQIFTLYNDGHSLWAVDQSGVKHQVIKVQTAGNPLQLGQAGDITEVLGNALVDGTLTATGDATFNGAGNGITVTNNALISGNETVTGSLTVNGAGTGLTVTNNELVSGTLTVTGDVTLNGAGVGLAVTNNETVGGTLAVTGTSTLTGDVLAGGAVSLTSNTQPIVMKDKNGTGIDVMLFDAVVAKQLNILDGTAGELANIKSNTKVNGSLESTGAATMDTTLAVTGVSTLTGEVDAGADVKLTANAKAYYAKDQAGTSYLILGFDAVTAKQLNILDGTSGQLLNVKSNTKVNGTLESTGAATMDTTLAVTGVSTLTGALNANGGITLPNATFISMKDHLGTARNILEVDSSDLVRLFLTSLGDRMLVQDSAGTETYLDLQPNTIIIGDATAKLPVTIHGNVTLTDGTLTAAGANSLGTAGNLQSILGNLTINQILSVLGSSSLDNGLITTDGSGTLQLSKAGTNFNGSVGGTATVLTPVWGASLKIMIVSFQSYNSANAISFAFPSSMARGFFFVGNQGGATTTSTFKSGGVGVNVRLITTLGGASAGATTTSTNIFQDSLGSIISTIDTWTMTATGGATSSAIVCIGV